MKSDGAGRVQTPVERQVKLVREFERSGLSAHVSRRSPGSTIRPLRHGGAGMGLRARPGGQCKPLFLEVTASQTATAAAALEIALPGGARLTLHDAQQVPLLAALIKALA